MRRIIVRQIEMKSEIGDIGLQMNIETMTEIRIKIPVRLDVTATTVRLGFTVIRRNGAITTAAGLLAEIVECN